MVYAELCCSYAAAVFASVVALPHLLSKLYEKTEPTVLFLPPVYPDYIGFDQLAHIAQILGVLLPDVGVQLLQWCFFGLQLSTCTGLIGVLLWSLVRLVRFVQRYYHKLREFVVPGVMNCFKLRRKAVGQDATSLVHPPPQRLASAENITPGERPNEATPGEGLNAATRPPLSQAIHSAIMPIAEESSRGTSSSESEETRRRESQDRIPMSLVEPEESLSMEMANQRTANVVSEIDAEKLRGEMGLDSSLSFTAGSRRPFERQSLPVTKTQTDSHRADRRKVRRSKTTPSRDLASERRLLPSAPPVGDIVPNQEEEPSAPPIQDGALFRNELQGRRSSSFQQQRTVEETLFAKQAPVSRGASILDRQDVKSSAVSDKTASKNDDYLNDVQNSTPSNEPEKSQHHNLAAMDFSAVKEPAGDLEKNDDLIPSMSLESGPQVASLDEASEAKGKPPKEVDALDLMDQWSAPLNPAVDMDSSRDPTVPPIGATLNNDVDLDAASGLSPQRTQATTTDAQRQKTGDEEGTSAEIKQTQSPNARGENVHTSSIVTETVESSSQTAPLHPQESPTDFNEKREDIGIGATSSEIYPEPHAAVLERGEDDTLGKTNTEAGAQQETE